MAAFGGERGAPALSVHNLSKRFGARVAFQDVAFEIGCGEVFGFLAENPGFRTQLGGLPGGPAAGIVVHMIPPGASPATRGRQPRQFGSGAGTRLRGSRGA